MVTVVVIHSDHVLHGQDVAVGSQAQVLLDAFRDHTRLEQVHGVLDQVGSGAAGQGDQLVVHHHAQAAEVGHINVGVADATATPGDAASSSQSRGGEGQLADLHQVRIHIAVHCDGVEVIATLTKQVASSNHVGSRGVVGLSCTGGAGLVGLVSTKDASSADAAEQTSQLGQQGCGLQLVDCSGQLVADMTQGVSARTELGQIIGSVGKATVQDGHDLAVSRGLLRSQVTSGRGAPVGGRGNLLFRGVDGIEEGDLNAGAASAGIQSSVTGNDARLDPLGLEENTFSGVLKELGARNQIRQKCSAGVVLKACRHWIAPVGLVSGVPHRG